MAQTKAQAAIQQSTAEQVAKDQKKAKIGLPNAASTLTTELDNIDNVKESKGFDSVVGVNPVSRFLSTSMTGSPARDTLARLEQIKGSTAISAAHEFQGTGRVMQSEIKPAIAAQGRLSDMGQDKKTYTKALDDYGGEVAKHLINIYQAAGTPIPPEVQAKIDKYLPGQAKSSTQPTIKMYNPKTGGFE
jgi:hypothetical protein